MYGPFPFKNSFTAYNMIKVIHIPHQLNNKVSYKTIWKTLVRKDFIAIQISLTTITMAKYKRYVTCLASPYCFSSNSGLTAVRNLRTCTNKSARSNTIVTCHTLNVGVGLGGWVAYPDIHGFRGFYCPAVALNTQPTTT